MNYLQLKIHKLMHWEYWPMTLVYSPIMPVWLFYAFRAKSLFFFNAANPSIKNGGMAMESKKEIYDIIPSQYIPKTILIKRGTATCEILKEASEKGIGFPFIVKPDIGMKSFAVDKISCEEDLEIYRNKILDDFIVQELIDYPNEVGIFYVRLPNSPQGNITGIVSKEFLSVTGNGTDSILKLIHQLPRGYLQLKELKRKYGDDLNSVLPLNEVFILVPYGSHTRGAKFTDATCMLNDTLLRTIDSICRRIPGFYFGRLDIRYSTFEELSEGKNFSIIEINGAGSEPTHIYDPKHSIFFAWKEVVKHWKLLYQVSKINNSKGFKYLSYKDGRDMLRANSQLEARLKQI